MCLIGRTPIALSSQLKPYAHYGITEEYNDCRARYFRNRVRCRATYLYRQFGIMQRSSTDRPRGAARVWKTPNPSSAVRRWSQNLIIVTTLEEEEEESILFFRPTHSPLARVIIIITIIYYHHHRRHRCYYYLPIRRDSADRFSSNYIMYYTSSYATMWQIKRQTFVPNAPAIMI